MRKILVIAACGLCAISACDKDKDSDIKTHSSTCQLSEANLAGTYRIKAIQYFSAGSNTPIDSLANYPACDRDNIYTLLPNNTYQYKDVGITCSPMGGAAGTWSLGENVFTLDRNVGTIEQFNCDGFTVLSKDVKNNGDRLHTVYSRL